MSQKPPNPFKGLASYQRSDFGSLFGRDTDFNVMRGRVFAARTTLFFAGPGVGKTSFFEAKFIPEMERRHEGELTVCYHREWSGSDPLASVRQSLGAAPGESLTDFFTRKGGRWILVLDQFEEMFQNPEYWTTSLGLREELALVVNSKLPVSTVFSMREEFLGHLSFLDNKIPDVFQNYYRLRNPSRDSAADIIEMTCGDVLVDEGGLKRLVDDLLKVEVPSAARQPRYLTRESIFLPFLQLVCQSLWERQPAPAGEKPFVFLSDYPETTDGMSPAAHLLEDYCGNRLKRLPGDQRRLIAHALDYLVTSQGAKRAYEAGALAGLMRVKKPEALKGALDALRGAGMLRSWDRDEEHWYELAHDMYAPILYRWKGRYQEEANQARTAKVYSVVATALVFAFAALMFYSAKTRNDLANSLDARASYKELQEDRDQAILLRLAALEIDPTDERRRAAAAIAYPADQLQFTLRHEAPVVAMNYTADGAFIVTASGRGVSADDEPDGNGSRTTDGTRTVVQAWDAKTGKPAGPAWNLPAAVTAVALLPSGQLLATAGIKASLDEISPRKSELCFWQPGNRTFLSCQDVECKPDRLAFNRNGDRLLAACQDSGTTGWGVIPVPVPVPGRNAVAAGELTWRRAKQVTFNPEGTRAAFTEVEGSPLSLIDTASGQSIRIVSAPASISALTFSSDGRRLYAADAHGGIQVINPDNGQTGSIKLAASGVVRSMAESADGGSLLGVTARPGSIVEWNLRTGQQKVTLLPGWIYSPCHPLPSSRLVLQEAQGDLYLWDAARGVPVRHAVTGATARALAVSSDRQQVLTLESRGVVHAWKFPATLPYEGATKVWKASLSRDGSTVAVLTGLDELNVRTWSPAYIERKFKLPIDADQLHLSSNGDFAAVVSDTKVQVWNTRTGVSSPVVQLPDTSPFHAAVRDDGALLAVFDDALWVCSFGSGTALPMPGIPRFKFTDRPDLSRWGNYLALRDGPVTVWDTRTKKNRTYSRIPPGDPAFSEDERYLFLLQRDARGEPTVLDLNTGKAVTLKHNNTIDIAISPDGRYAVTSANEPELRIWSMDQGQQLGGMQFGTSIKELSFTPEGKLFAATRRWSYWFPPAGNDARIALPLSGEWTGDYGNGKDGVRALLSPAIGWVYPVLLRPAYPSENPLTGEPTDLKHAWEKKLNLRLASGEVAPINAVRLPRPDAPRSR